MIRIRDDELLELLSDFFVVFCQGCRYFLAHVLQQERNGTLIDLGSDRTRHPLLVLRLRFLLSHLLYLGVHLFSLLLQFLELLGELTLQLAYFPVQILDHVRLLGHRLLLLIYLLPEVLDQLVLLLYFLDSFLQFHFQELIFVLLLQQYLSQFVTRYAALGVEIGLVLEGDEVSFEVW